MCDYQCYNSNNVGDEKPLVEQKLTKTAEKVQNKSLERASPISQTPTRISLATPPTTPKRQSQAAEEEQDEMQSLLQGRYSLHFNS